jgi:glycogen operon protein
MSEEHWMQGAKSISVFLNGEGIPDPGARGEPITDDSFFIFFNADYEPLAFVIPAGEWALLWSKVIDTGSEADPEEALYETGEELKVQGRSLVILQRV